MKTCKDCGKTITKGSKTGYCVKCSRKHFPVWNTGKKETRVEVLEKLSLAKLNKAPHNKGKNMSIQQRIKISCINQNISLNEFNGFKTLKNRIERSKLYYLNLNSQCFERDNYTCQCCSKRGGSLNAHHLNSWKHFPDQRYRLDNLVTLCKSCHKEFHKVYGNGKNSPNTLNQFLLFKSSR